MEEQEFAVGDVVEAVAVSGYWNLTRGKHYVLVDIRRPVTMPNGYQFPQYLIVVDDNGKRAYCHTYRFKKVQYV